MDTSYKPNQRTLLRPALSADNEYLAAIVPAHSLQIISLRTGCVVTEIQFPKTSWTFLSQARVLRWAPDVQEEEDDSCPSRAWILVANDSRLIAVEVELPSRKSRGAPLPALVTPVNVLADYNFESQYGKIIVVDFVINHCQALLTFEANTHASVVYFTKPQRDDIPYPKFSDRRGFVSSNHHQHFALLLRSKGQDNVAVFSSLDGIVQNMATFAAATADAQGLIWSPNNDPVLAVWDTATYGSCVKFFTALGHPLRNLDLQPQDTLFGDQTLGVPGMGISCLSWVASVHRDTLFAAAGGHRQLLLRGQNSMKVASAEAPQPSNSTTLLTTLIHKSVVDGSQSMIWQQLNDRTFDAIKTKFEVQFDVAAEIDMIEISSAADMVATKLDQLPKCIWIWDCNTKYPVAAIMLQHNVRSFKWHPSVPNLMVIVTDEKRPCIYVLHQITRCPAKIIVPLADQTLNGKWKVEWVVTPDATSCPLLISSNKQFEIGLLGLMDGEVVFESALRSAVSADTPTDDSIVDTPSKSGKINPATGWNLGDTGLWDAALNEKRWQMIW